MNMLLQKKSIFLRFLVSAGFGRGALRARILKSWKAKFGIIVDISAHGINYRFNLNDNVIDCKIFASSSVYDKKRDKFFYRKPAREGCLLGSVNICSHIDWACKAFCVNGFDLVINMPAFCMPAVIFYVP
ncbi:MAG: hypothetical protein EYX74_03475 [Desulfobulbaceae bacterium]|nr:MAG: hypothetical protein EYX74_03475 [Desulfobulbaceae bacterium]